MNIELLSFLSELKKNNTKEWFDLNRKTYENLRIEFIKFIEDLIVEISKFDASISNVDAKKSIFRINKDIRFSKDKSPYKTNFGAFISNGGKKASKAGYYIHLEPNNVFIAAGIWQPDAAVLSKIRQEIDYNSTTFLKLIESEKVQKTFGELDFSDALKLMPKGYDANMEYSKYLRLKSYIFIQKIKNDDVFTKKGSTWIANQFKIVAPFNAFINNVFDDEN